jgi:hypothetical protein
MHVYCHISIDTKHLADETRMEICNKETGRLQFFTNCHLGFNMIYRMDGFLLSSSSSSTGFNFMKKIPFLKYSQLSLNKEWGFCCIKYNRTKMKFHYKNYFGQSYWCIPSSSSILKFLMDDCSNSSYLITKRQIGAMIITL